MKAMKNCIKCNSSSIIPMEYPLDSKGLKCIICGKDMWYDLIDKEGSYSDPYKRKDTPFPKPPRKSMLR